MTASRPRHTVDSVLSRRVPRQLPPAVIRPREQVEAVLEQSLQETGKDGRTASAWEWALTGTRPSPVTLSPPPGDPPSRQEILAEADAEPEGSTAPPGVPADFCDQFGEARRVLAWLIGRTDEVPVDDDNRGRFIGARDDYARTDDTIRQVRDNAMRGLQGRDPPDPMDPDDAQRPWRLLASWMNAAWLRGVRDLLTWVLREDPISPLSKRAVSLPTVYDLTYEDTAANDLIMQGAQAAFVQIRTPPHHPNTAKESRPPSAGSEAKPQPCLSPAKAGAHTE